jgi:hypothetical protein
MAVVHVIIPPSGDDPVTLELADPGSHRSWYDRVQGVGKGKTQGKPNIASKHIRFAATSEQLVPV